MLLDLLACLIALRELPSLSALLASRDGITAWQENGSNEFRSHALQRHDAFVGLLGSMSRRYFCHRGFVGD